MIVGTAIVTIHIPWAQSLKDKRTQVKSLCAKARNTFNISIAEVDCQDIHQRAVLGFACVVNETALADSIIDNVLRFLQANISDFDPAKHAVPAHQMLEIDRSALSRAGRRSPKRA